MLLGGTNEGNVGRKGLMGRNKRPGRRKDGEGQNRAADELSAILGWDAVIGRTDGREGVQMKPHPASSNSSNDDIYASFEVKRSKHGKTFTPSLLTTWNLLAEGTVLHQN